MIQPTTQSTTQTRCDLCQQDRPTEGAVRVAHPELTRPYVFCGACRARYIDEPCMRAERAVTIL